jgi:hypothetical protein
VAILFISQLDEFFDLLIEPIGIAVISFQNQELFIGCSDNSFSFNGQLLMELLAGAKPGKFNFKVSIRVCIYKRDEA